MQKLRYIEKRIHQTLISKQHNNHSEHLLAVSIQNHNENINFEGGSYILGEDE